MLKETLFISLDNALDNDYELAEWGAEEIANELGKHDSFFESYETEALVPIIQEWLDLHMSLKKEIGGNMEIRNVKIEYHRNGISGIGFRIIYFEYRESTGSGYNAAQFEPMFAVSFENYEEEPEFMHNPSFAVFHLSDLAKLYGSADLKGVGAMRGDNFAYELRPIIEELIKQEDRAALEVFNKITKS